MKDDTAAGALAKAVSEANEIAFADLAPGDERTFTYADELKRDAINSPPPHHAPKRA